MYICHYLDWQRFQQIEMNIAQQSYTWWQEKRHAHSETINNPEQIIGLLTDFQCDWINSLFYIADTEFPSFDKFLSQFKHYRSWRSLQSNDTQHLNNLSIHIVQQDKSVLWLRTSGSFSTNWSVIKRTKKGEFHSTKFW